MFQFCGKHSSLRMAAALLAVVTILGTCYYSTVRHMTMVYIGSNNLNNLDDHTGRPPNHHGNAQEVRHIAFLKVHKCASSTVLNTMYRFGLKRDLTFVLPVHGNYIRFEKNKITVLPPVINSNYDMLCNHVNHFNKTEFAHYLPSDSVYLAIVREPFQRMQSAFNYYRDVFNYRHLMAVKGDNPFETYLKDPESYESKWTSDSVTNNNMARDFGFPYMDYRNKSKFRSYLQNVESTFQLVLVVELYDESLILMRRMLNWSLSDVLYLAKNVHSSKPLSKANVTSRINPFLALDRILYDHFVSILKTKIKEGGRNLQEEVEYFRHLNKRTINFCNATNTLEKMPVRASKWNEEFTLKKADCVLMKMHEISLLQMVRRIHISKINRFGANITKLLQ